MRSHKNPFSVLARRAGSGDAFAQLQLRRDLEPQLVHIVRRVIRDGVGRSSLDRRILVEAKKIGLTADSASRAEGEFLVRQVARCVCSLVMAGVKPAACVDGRLPLQDTVCN